MLFFIVHILLTVQFTNYQFIPLIHLKLIIADMANLFAIGMSGFSSILMMAACASYTNSPANIVNVPWAIYKTSSELVTPSADDDSDDTVVQNNMQQWIGLRGVVTQDYAYTRKGDDDTQSNIGEPVLQLFQDKYDELQCPNDDSGFNADGSTNTETCIAMSKCLGTGKVVVAFIVLGFLLAIVSMVISGMRRKCDGYFKKLLSIIFSCSTILCCVISFTAFSPCLGYNWPLLYNRILGEYKYMYPGAGGAMAITSFVFFSFVAIANFIIPAGTENEGGEAAKAEGAATDRI